MRMQEGVPGQFNPYVCLHQANSVHDKIIEHSENVYYTMFK